MSSNGTANWNKDVRLIPPRLRRSDLIRQPGMLFLGLMFSLSVPFMLVSALIPHVSWTNTIMALVLGLSWTAASRRYWSRAEPGWIEGIGRTGGIGVIVSPPRPILYLSCSRDWS